MSKEPRFGAIELVKIEAPSVPIRVPYYIVFSRYTNRVRFFRLEGGHYQEQPLDAENPRIWIEGLEIGLGLWLGEFAGATCLWLRWYDAEGNWIPTDTEVERKEKEQAIKQVELERKEKEQAIEQLLQVARNLLQTGMSIAQVSQLTGLPPNRGAEVARTVSDDRLKFKVLFLR